MAIKASDAQRLEAVFAMERLPKSGLNRVFGNPDQDPAQNDLIRYLKKDLKENREIIDHVYVHFVFKGDVDAAENSDGLSNGRVDIESKTHLISNYFRGKEVELQVDFIADRPSHRGPPPGQSYVLHLRQAGTTTHDGRVMHVGFVPLMDLYGIYRALGQTFLERNIHAALKPDNAPNKRIREALENRSQGDGGTVRLRLPPQRRHPGRRAGQGGKRRDQSTFRDCSTEHRQFECRVVHGRECRQSSSEDQSR